MKYLKLNNDFTFDNLKIDESMFYMSPKIREQLSKLSNKDNEIAKNLLEVEFTDVKPDITFIDLTDKEGFISFTQIKKADKLVTQKHDSVDVIKGTNQSGLREPEPLTKLNIDFLYKNDKQGFEISTGVFTKGRNQVKMGKLVNKMFPGKFKDKEIEEFVNLFKSSSSENSESERFELVSGEDIEYWYDCDNYYDGRGTLGSSCMRNKKVFDLYTENPDVCQMLVLIDNKTNKLLGRALVWKPIIGGSWRSPDRLDDMKYFMDRVYTNSDSDVNRFHDFAEKKGWGRKTRNDYSSHELVTYKGKEFVVNMEVELADDSYDNYPYMDTFAEFLDGTLYNNNNHENGGYLLNGTSGEYEEEGYWSDYYNDQIPADEAVYSDYLESYIWRDRSVEVTLGERSNQGYYPDDHNDIYYDEWRDEYINIEDAIHSIHHDSHIYEEDAISCIVDIDDDGSIIDEDFFHNDDYNRIVISTDIIKEQDLLWFDKIDEEHNWSDFRGILIDLLTKDYKGMYILEEFKIKTIGKTEPDLFSDSIDFLSEEDHLLINDFKPEIDGSYSERVEDKFSYMKRVWVDSGRDLSIIKDESVKEFIDTWFEDELLEKDEVVEKLVLRFNSFKNL